MDMLKQKMKGLFQVQSLIFNEQTQPKDQVNKGGERIVREHWDPKSEDLVSKLRGKPWRDMPAEEYPGEIYLKQLTLE